MIRLLEARFGVVEPQITPWRRAVTGDLTSVFDFAAGERTHAVMLPDASSLSARAQAQASLPSPRPPAAPGPLPRQEAGARPARPLPYAFDASARLAAGGVHLTIANFGAAGAGFSLFPAGDGDDGPWSYTVEAGKTLEDQLPARPRGYDLALYGPNGFLRRFRGGSADPLEVGCRYDRAEQTLQIVLRNLGEAPVSLHIANAYAGGEGRRRGLAAGAELVEAWRIVEDGHWYDISVTVAEDPPFLRRLAGHIETGRPSRSDPALDWRPFQDATTAAAPLIQSR